jgi:hypothetical protein
MLSKILSLGLTSLLGLALTTAYQPPPPEEGAPPPPKTKKKDDPGPPEGGLRKTYDLLRRLRSENRTAGRPEERLRDWTERATGLYREAVKAEKAGNDQAAHEYGVAAHDLARAVELARGAALSDQAEAGDPDLPPPPSGPGPEGDRERVTRDLNRAYDHIRDQLDKDDAGKDAKFYNEASRDLYNAARRDAEAGRLERAGELARAAEAMSHVNEHLAHATGRRPGPPDDDAPRAKAKTKPDPKSKARKGDNPEKKKRPDAKGDRPEPRDERPAGTLPPPL